MKNRLPLLLAILLGWVGNANAEDAGMACSLPDGGQSGMAVLFDQINAHRLAQGFVPLQFSVPLTIAAQVYACKLVAPETSGVVEPSRTLAYVEMRRAGCNTTVFEDAVHRGPVDGMTSFMAMRNKPGVGKALASGRLNQVGLGIASTGLGDPVWVVLTSAGCGN